VAVHRRFQWGSSETLLLFSFSSQALHSLHTHKVSEMETVYERQGFHDR
jgi:hypothetical protein